MLPTTQASNSLTGVIESVVFNDDESGYSVLSVCLDGHGLAARVVGTCARPLVGERITAEGGWKIDPKYGSGFHAVKIETTTPTTLEGIVKFLGCGIIPGVGPGIAAKLVKAFGADVFRVIELEPMRLRKPTKFSKDKCEDVRAAWIEHRDLRELMVFLHSNNLGAGRAQRIQKRYGKDAVAKIQANPFCLADDVDGIGFKTADDVATRLGVPLDSPYRIASSIDYVLGEESARGHSGYPHTLLIAKAREVLGIDVEPIEKVLEAKASAGELVIEEDGGLSLVYLPSLHRAECDVANRIRNLVNTPPTWPKLQFDALLKDVESSTGMALAIAQREAITTILTSRVTVITGGPGVGKSTILNSLLKIADWIDCKAILAAPTGRAAKRMAEVTRKDAKTIHRLLDMRRGQGEFYHNEEHPLEGDLLVIDEASMLDIRLANSLLCAVPDSMHVVFIGDIDQLPSVGPGSVLRDIIQSEIVPVVRLTQVFRQAAESRIITGAHDINHGIVPRGGVDFFFIQEEDPQKIADTVVDLVAERLPKKYKFDPLKDIQVLTPMHGGVNGTKSLNEAIHKRLMNPHTPVFKYHGRTFRAGDKVIQTRNNYDLEIFNGDIGVIAYVDPDDKIVTVMFDGRMVTLKRTDLADIQLAHVVTIHKSQGSEFPAVIIPVHTQHFVMLQRNLLYTGVTRGKKLVVLVGSPAAVRIAVSKVDSSKRYGGLSAKLKAHSGKAHKQLATHKRSA